MEIRRRKERRDRGTKEREGGMEEEKEKERKGGRGNSLVKCNRRDLLWCSDRLIRGFPLHSQSSGVLGRSLTF